MYFSASSPSSSTATFSIFSRGYRELSANWAYSIGHFGGVKDVLLFTFDDESLMECLTLGFVCFNGRLLFPNNGKEVFGNMTFSSDLQLNRHFWNQVISNPSSSSIIIIFLFSMNQDHELPKSSLYCLLYAYIHTCSLFGPSHVCFMHCWR